MSSRGGERLRFGIELRNPDDGHLPADLFGEQVRTQIVVAHVGGQNDRSAVGREESLELLPALDLPVGLRAGLSKPPCIRHDPREAVNDSPSAEKIRDPIRARKNRPKILLDRSSSRRPSEIEADREPENQNRFDVPGDVPDRPVVQSPPEDAPDRELFQKSFQSSVISSRERTSNGRIGRRASKSKDRNSRSSPG